MLVESAFRSSFLHGPSILYEDIMSRAVPAFDLSGPLQDFRLRINLREKGHCFMCEMGFGPDTKGQVRAEIVETGGNPAHLMAFALKTRTYWIGTVCGRCSDSGSLQRCRHHLMEDATKGRLDSVSLHRNLVRNVYNHLVVYTRSFVWGYHGTATEEDRAALISAVGWCSGWRPLLKIMEDHGLL